MSIQITRNRNILTIVLFALALAMAITLISTSPAAAAENGDDSRITQLEQQVARLEQQLAQSQSENALLQQTVTQQNVLLEQLQKELNTEYFLILRHEDLVLSDLFGDCIVVNTRFQEVSVSKATYDSCQVGDDITSTPQHRLLASGTISQTRVIVEDKLPPR